MMQFLAEVQTPTNNCKIVLLKYLYFKPALDTIRSNETEVDSSESSCLGFEDSQAGAMVVNYK